MGNEESVRRVTPTADGEITIEVNEWETVQMEWNGQLITLYEGKGVPPTKKPAKKPAAPAKPAVAATTEKAVVAAPVAPRRPVPPARKKGSRANVKVEKGKGPKKPLISDDSQHSIHTLSFEDKLKAVSKEIKSVYQQLSSYLTDVYGCSHRTSFAMDGYRVGRELLVALSLSSEHVRVNGAIDAKVYQDSKMPINHDKDAKHYADVPSYMKVKSEKSLKQALKFIDDVMKAHGVKKISK